jgi:hypothetical protein
MTYCPSGLTTIGGEGKLIFSPNGEAVRRDGQYSICNFDRLNASGCLIYSIGQPLTAMLSLRALAHVR